MTPPTLYVVAGPNGSGKSTLTKSGRFRDVRIVDPDGIAHRIAPDDPHGAGEAFVVETTLAGKSTLRLMDDARAAGYRIELHYVSVESVAQALDRISNRVALGGHPVPEEDVRRRFVRSLANLPEAMTRSDEARLYDNGSPDDPCREAAILTRDAYRFAENPPNWVTVAARRAGLAVSE